MIYEENQPPYCKIFATFELKDPLSFYDSCYFDKNSKRFIINLSKVLEPP